MTTEGRNQPEVLEREGKRERKIEKIEKRERERERDLLEKVDLPFILRDKIHSRESEFVVWRDSESNIN